MSTATEERTGRLFRTLVLMGSSLALGCGGVTETASGGAGDGGTSSGGSPGSGGAGSGSGGSGSGSGGVFGSGGSTSTGGQAAIAPGPFDCEPAQLACATFASTCGYNEHIDDYGDALPPSCTCDVMKPLTAEDCAEGETFLCERAAFDHRYNPFDRLIDVNCRCVADETDCSEVCGTYRCLGHEGAVGDAPTPALCDCAFPVLR